MRQSSRIRSRGCSLLDDSALDPAAGSCPDLKLWAVQLTTAPLFAEPFVKSPEFTIESFQTIAKALASFEPPEPLTHVNILLFGGVGAGKSSAISTLDSVLKSRISRIAPYGAGTQSFTSTLTRHTFRQGGGALKLQLWDVAGWSSLDYQGGELGLLLDGHLPEGANLREGEAALVSSKGFVRSPTIQDQVRALQEYEAYARALS